MAFVQSHKIEYKDCAGVNTLIEIWDEGFVGSITECQAAEDPLNVDIAPADPTIFAPVIGTGATINILSVTEGQHRGLYTINPVKRMVKIFKADEALPWWLGYINTEQYGEPYSLLTDYVVTINCNNGFNALMRFKYIDGGTKYSTLETKWNVLTRILAKAGLPYQYIYFATKLSCDGVTPAANETLFHNLLVDQLNYYDEQNEPMTYREVLEALLAASGLQIRQECGSVFLYEPQMLADASFSAKRFNGTTYAYIDAVTVARNFDISSEDINWDNDDHVLDTVAGFCKQKIRYSPHIYEGAVPEVDITKRIFWPGTESWAAPDAYNTSRMSVSPMGDIAQIEVIGAHVELRGHKLGTDGTEDIYLEGSSWGTEREWIRIDGHKGAHKDNQALMVEGEVFIRSKTDEFSNEEESVYAKNIIVRAVLDSDLKGPHFNITWSWTTEYDPLEYSRGIVKNYTDASVCDRWYTFKMLLPSAIPGGDFRLRIFDPEVYMNTFTPGDLMSDGDGLICARMRNFKVRVVDIASYDLGFPSYNGAKEIVDEDASYICTLDEAFESEGPEITLLHADAKTMIDRGAIRKLDKSFTLAWSKTGDVSTYRLVDILLRSISSQYQESLAKLSGTIEAPALMEANGGPNFLFTLQDTDYLGTKKLMFNGGTYNDFKRTLNGSFIEVKEEDVTITVS